MLENGIFRRSRFTVDVVFGHFRSATLQIHRLTQARSWRCYRRVYGPDPFTTNCSSSRVELSTTGHFVEVLFHYCGAVSTPVPWSTVMLLKGLLCSQYRVLLRKSSACSELPAIVINLRKDSTLRLCKLQNCALHTAEERKYKHSVSPFSLDAPSRLYLSCFLDTSHTLPSVALLPT